MEKGRMMRPMGHVSRMGKLINLDEICARKRKRNEAFE
jgi:hypothetical protein